MDNFEREDLLTSIDLTLRWVAISFLLWAIFVYGIRPIDVSSATPVEINVRDLDIGMDAPPPVVSPNKEVMYGD